jgi:hypothetical protein
VVKTITFGFATLALAVASAATSYNVTFFETVTVNGTKLKAGDYKVQINDNKAIIKQGKAVAETAVKVENNDRKYPTTTVRLAGAQVEEIHFGGTRTKVVFEKTGDATN